MNFTSKDMRSIGGVCGVGGVRVQEGTGVGIILGQREGGGWYDGWVKGSASPEGDLPIPTIIEVSEFLIYFDFDQNQRED